MSITLEVLHVPGCPNAAPLLEHLRQATDLPVTTREITTEVEAATSGMAGSPTLLVDGRDPFSGPEGCACGIACRIYRDEHGRVAPAPSAAQLRAALTSLRPRPRASPPACSGTCSPPVERSAYLIDSTSESCASTAGSTR